MGKWISRKDAENAEKIIWINADKKTADGRHRLLY